jgi:sterol desaturase/sphingolipid hydroxylase (fatty acid hydroxylase superfamily)
MEIFYTILGLFFVFGSFFEWWITRKDSTYYSFSDLKSSIMLLLSGLFIDMGIKSFVIYLFYQLAPYTLFNLSYQWWVWMLCYIFWDLIFYLKHYLEHNVRFMWAIHINHHSSSYMNLSTSLRSGVFKATYRYFFWLIIILFGFPIPMFLVLYGIGKVWAFFSHSQKLGHWGFLEKFTVTPTHHLLHHSCNENNLNKNFGETFLVWDKLFGTFKANNELLVYGIKEKINHNDFKDVVFHEFINMKKDLNCATNFKEKLKIIFGKPR